MGRGIKNKKVAVLITSVILFWLISPGLVKAVSFSLSFDGEDDYVEVLNAPSLNFGIGNFTLETWIKNQGENGGIIAHYDNELVKGYYLELNSYSIEAYIFTNEENYVGVRNQDGPLNTEEW